MIVAESQCLTETSGMSENTAGTNTDKYSSTLAAYVIWEKSLIYLKI